MFLEETVGCVCSNLRRDSQRFPQSSYEDAWAPNLQFQNRKNGYIPHFCVLTSPDTELNDLFISCSVAVG